MLSAVTETRWTDDARSAGVLTCLAKPVREQRLVATLEAILAQRAAGRDPAPSGARPAARPRSRPRILLAEDNAINARVALRLLGRLGYESDAVANGREAVEAVLRGDYDLVLMDWQMPVMDGLQAALEIRRREPAGRRTPIVAMTASAMEADRDACLAAGMDDHVGKPVRPDELQATLERWLGRAALSA